MAALRTALTIIYIIICVALVVIVLMQEGKSAGLSGSINGVADTYWGKNKGRSIEGADVIFILEPISWAIIEASVVLPSPGGP